MSSLFAFCGPIGSGKSSVSKLFALQMGAKWNSFGTTVRDIAQDRGLPTGREDLQKLGAILVAGESDAFCRRVVAGAAGGADKAVVIDGLRHLHILSELRRIESPKRVLCIFVDAPLAARLERVKKRDGLSREQLASLGKHSTEIEVEHRLRGCADFIADNSRSTDACVNTIIEWTKRRGILG